MRLFSLLLSLLPCSTLCAQLTTSPPGTPATTVSTIIGPGVTISNITVNCDTGAYGYFVSNSTPIQLPSGVIMTTGKHSLTVGPNGSASAGYAVGTSGADPQLTALEPTATLDLCAIEFDCVPQNGALQFSFVFGSEEYPEFNFANETDVFGVFISGPNPAGGAYVNLNLATLPTLTPVGINTVNSSTNSSYYISAMGDPHIEYDGVTVRITPVIAVSPTYVYHLKFAIADAAAATYDSGLFLEGSSLSSPVSVEEEGMLRGLKIYPNPAEEIVRVIFPYPATGQAKISLLTVLGQTVFSLEKTVDAGEAAELDVRELPAGIYSAVVELEGVRAVRKIVVGKK